MSKRGLTVLLAFGFLVVQAQERESEGITFLKKADAAKAIVDDKAEPYFSTMQPMEMSAKTGAQITGKTLKEKRQECRRRYAANTLDFTKDEQQSITALINDVQPILQKEYPRFGSRPWSFLKLNNVIEGGLPHTRGAHIVLSKRTCETLVRVAKQEKTSFMRMHYLDLMVHEQMHVFQRTFPNTLDSLYLTVWKFEKATAIIGNEYLKKHHLSNPDAVVCPWVFPTEENGRKTIYWPLVTFSAGDGLKRMPMDFQMLGIELKKTEKGYAVKEGTDGVPQSKPLMNIMAYRRILPFSTNIYHPDEMSADAFAKLIMVDHFYPAPPNPQQKARMEHAFAPLRTWFKKNLQAKEK